MSKLRLRIDQYLDSDGGPPPEAIATIYTLDPDSGLNLPNTPHQRERIPITHQDSQSRSVDVQAGRYRVEVVLPTGEILSEIVRVAKDKEEPVVLTGLSSPHEWLGWQYLMGNVSAAKSPRPRRAPTRTRALAPKRFTARASKAKKQPERPAGAKARGAKRTPTVRPAIVLRSSPAQVAFNAFRTSVARTAPNIKVDRPIHWLAQPWPMLLGPEWLLLAQVAGAPHGTMLDLNSGEPPRPLAPITNDPERAVFRVTHGASASSSAMPLQSTLPRDYIVAESQGTLELLSLPTPWLVVSTGREAVIEIIVQQVPRAGEFASSIAVRDERLGLLLGYLSSGALTTATQIAEGARDMLFMKVTNPLAAAAGGYALIGTETDASPKEWHQWIQNLMKWNPHLPDGAIQWAMLQMRRGPSQSKEACIAFKAACQRGLPYYSLGLRWLLDGLERFGSRDTEAATMACAVRAIASRMHQQSPFTILRLGAR